MRRRLLNALVSVCLITSIGACVVMAVTTRTRLTLALSQQRTCSNNAEWRESKTFEVHAERGRFIVCTALDTALPYHEDAQKPAWNPVTRYVTVDRSSVSKPLRFGVLTMGRHWVAFSQGRQRHFGFPIWPLTLIPSGLMLVWGIGRVRRHRHARLGSCPSCGYDLRATPSRCPECGRAVTPVAG